MQRLGQARPDLKRCDRRGDLFFTVWKVIEICKTNAIIFENAQHLLRTQS